MSDYSAKELIQRARTRMLSGQPFNGHIAMGLKLRECTDMPTMATDMIHLFYNPEFVQSLTKTQLVGAIWHETQHAYMKHPLRMIDMCKCYDLHHPDGTTDDHTCYIQVAQYSADEACNPPLKDAGADLIEGAVYPPQANWGDSFEEHFNRNKKTAKKVKCGGGCSGIRAPQGKGGKNGGGLSDREKQELDAGMNQKIIQAANFARSMGKLPADIERMLESMRAPKVSWQDVLRRFMQAITKNDYRMLPPNKRYLSQDIYLPSLRSESVANVLLVIDGSGSTMNVFPQFISEFASILLDVRPEQLHVVVWDTRPTWYRVFDNFADESNESIVQMQPEMGAGGGSVFTECFNWFHEKTGIIPQVGLVLTDMEIMFPADPGYPVMWIATTDVDAPFGEVIKIEEEHRKKYEKFNKMAAKWGKSF